MHPGMMFWWKQRHGGCGERGEARSYGGGCGGWSAPGARNERSERMEASGGDGDFGGGAFGVRRPLRFLAYKLDLDERQVAELARILGELKTERAQAEVDGRRTVASFADAVAGSSFDETRAAEAAALRVKSAERLRDAVLGALRKIHALLGEEQRARLAYLIRTGVVSL